MFKKPSMVTHEASCTLNPKRVCFLCDGSVGIKEIVDAMRKRDDVECETCDENPRNPTNEDYWTTKSEKAIAWLMEEVAGCPACALAVLRQGRIFAFDVFDYKKSVSGWHQEQNKDFKMEVQGGISA
jgi:hypothetical protein